MTGTSPVIKPQHMRAAGRCVPQSLVWLRRHGWTMADVRHGKITAQMLRDTGDALVMDVASAAEKENSDGQ